MVKTPEIMWKELEMFSLKVMKGGNQNTFAFKACRFEEGFNQFHLENIIK